MWWLLAVIVVFMIFNRIDAFIELARSKNPGYQEKEIQRQMAHQQERNELVQQLEGLINSECLIKSNEFAYYGLFPTDTAQAKIIAVDDEWVEISTIRKRKQVHMFYKIENIISVSRVL